MGLWNLFHKIKIGFTRRDEPSIPRATSAKQYGDWGEDTFIYAVQDRLPDCKIKKNIIIQSAEGNAEIDCLILYKNKLFAIEVKRWKGHLVERGGDFVQYKRDRWTDEVHTKIQKSPFKQLRRAIYLLRKQIPDNTWINDIVFFEEAECVEAKDGDVWFGDINEIVAYIMSYGRASRGDSAISFFEKCIAADYLRGIYWQSSLHCIVCDESLRFNTPEGIITRNDISSISIKHHWSYDELKIKTLRGGCFISKLENASIYVIDNGYKKRYSLAKIDYVEFGH